MSFVMHEHWDLFRAHFNHFIGTQEAKQAFLKTRGYQALDRFDGPTEVVVFLNCQNGDLDEKDQILSTLVLLVQRREHHAIAYALLWLGLWPGLDSAYHRRRRHFQKAAELASEIACAFMTRIERFKHEAITRVAATLVRSTERDVMKKCKREWLREKRFNTLQNDSAREQPDSTESWFSENNRLRAVPSFDLTALHEWFSKILGKNAYLLMAVFSRPETQRQAAERLGIPYSIVRKRTSRAFKKVLTDIKKNVPLWCEKVRLEEQKSAAA